MSATYKIIRDGEEKTFENAKQFEDTKDLLAQNGVDFETEEPEDDEDNEDDESETDSGTVNAEIINETEPEPKTDGNGEVPETVSEVPDEPPERDITDDPIEWLNRAAGEFVDNIKGTEAINKKGFRVLQYWYDIDTDSEVIVGPEETDFEYCRVRATAAMPDGQTAVAHGSAHVDRGDEKPILLEMADTRAKSRALSDITGVGSVAVAELKKGEQ